MKLMERVLLLDIWMDGYTTNQQLISDAQLHLMNINSCIYLSHNAVILIPL